MEIRSVECQHSMSPRGQQPADMRKRFEVLVRPLLDDLFRVACCLESDRESAEDLLQETLLVGFRRFQQLREWKSFRAWMTKILRRRFLNRRRRVFEEISMDMEGLNSMDASLPQAHRMDPEEKLLARRLSAEIRQALRSLPLDQRMAVTLVDLLGFSYSETADALEAAPGTVASRVARGRDALRRSLRRVARERGWI
jgi:RNA polymerase sigma-70 factor (ECF subfamily)